MKKVLITGGAGYIGLFTAMEFRNMGYEVAIIDSNINYAKSVLKSNVKFFEGRIQNSRFLETVLVNFKPEGVVHLAAYALVGESYLKPLKYYQNNFLGTLKLMSQLVKKDIKQIVFASSCSVYGNVNNLPIREECRKRPVSPYAKSKLAVEKLLKWHSLLNNINCVCLRYFNVSGASLDGIIGENHNPETHLIPNIVNSALLGENLALKGKEYNTPDGTCIRDYIHVKDVARVNFIALDAFLSNKLSGFSCFNVGSGKGFSNLEIIKMCEQKLKRKVKLQIVKPRRGDSDCLIADTRKIRNKLNFHTSYSSIEKIIETQIMWSRNQLSL